MYILYIYIPGWPKKLKVLTNLVKHCINWQSIFKNGEYNPIYETSDEYFDFTKKSHNLSNDHQDSYLHYQKTWETNGYAKRLTSLGVPYNKSVFIFQWTYPNL